MNNVLFFIFTSVTIILSTGLNIKTSSRSALSMNFLGDLFKKSPQSTSMSNSKLIFTDSAPSWEELDQYIRRMEPATERSAFDSIQTGRGVTNHKANIRLFDAPDGYKPEITLYRDTAGWCPYCQKVWLQLEEKRLPYQVIKVPMRCYGDKPESFYKLNPSGGIPVATIKGKTLAESNDIMNEIEREFPSYKPLYPASGSPHAARVPGLLKLERRVFSVWFNWLTTNADAPAEKEMDSLLRQVDDELRSTQSGGPYFLGADVSIVDVMFAPFLERMAASLPYYKGFESRTSKYPNLLRWYESMDTRESFRGIKSDYYTHCRDLPPQIGRCYFRLPLAERFRDEIGMYINKYQPIVYINARI